ncbi:MAG: hypothetical protein WCT20_01200 [Candidatus Babeliales bacterium]
MIKKRILLLGVFTIIQLYPGADQAADYAHFMQMRSPIGLARMRAKIRFSRRGRVVRQRFPRGRTFVCAPETLMTSRRFDLMAKYIYAKAYDEGVKSHWPTEIYLAHLGAWVDWQDGLSHKYGQESFLKAFNSVLDSVKNDGYNPDRAPIPFGDGDILDGAHRVTSCLLYGYDVKCCVVSHRRARATSFFFRDFKRYYRKGLDAVYLDAMALQYCYLNKNARMVLFSPALESDVDIKGLLDKKGVDVIYAKHVRLTRDALSNFIALHKEGFGGLGSVDDDIHDDQWDGYAMLVVLDTSEEELFARYLNDRIPGINVVYSNDYTEAVECAQTFFNKNSIQFLHHTDMKKVGNFDAYVEKLRLYCMENDIDSDQLCVLSDITKSPSQWNSKHTLEIAIHGYHKIKSKLCPTSFFTIVNQEVGHDEGVLDDIIFDPRKHFYYKGIKCVIPW